MSPKRRTHMRTRKDMLLLRARLAMVEQAFRASQREIASLHQVAALAQHTQPLRTMLQQVVQEVSVCTGFPIVMIEFYDEDRQLMECAAATGIALSSDQDSVRVPFADTLSGRVAHSGQAIIEGYLQRRTEYTDAVLDQLGIQAVVCVPLFSAECVIGTFTLATPSIILLDDHLVSLVHSFASIIALLIARRQAEERSASVERQLYEILDKLAAGVVQLDINGRYLYVNQRAATMIGLTPADMIGKSIFDIHPPEVAQALLERNRQFIVRQDTAEYELTFDLPIGPRTFFIVDQVLTDVQGVGRTLLASAVDITAHTQTEVELQVALTKYRTLFDSFPLGVTVSDATGQIVETNQMAEQLLGLGREQQRQRAIDGAEWKIVRPDGLPMSVDEYASVRALKEQRIVENVEMGIVKPSHETTWINVTAAPLPLEGYGVVITYSDITMRRQMEELAAVQLDLARIIATGATTRSIWPHCLELALRVTGMDSGGIYLFDTAEQVLDLVCYQGLGEAFLAATAHYSSDMPNVQRMLVGKASYLSAEDIQQIELFQHEALTCVAIMPIRYQGQVLGCVNLASHTLPQVPMFARHALETIATEIGNIVIYMRTEAALRAEQVRLAKVAATLPGVINTFLLSPNGNLSIPYASRAFEDLYGLTLADVAETIDPLIARVPAEQVARLVESVHASARTLQSWRHEYQYQHPAKGLIWLEGYSMPIREPDGSIVWHGITTDVTERKLAEQQLRESQLRVELALKGANLGTWDWFVQTGQTVFNERWAEIIGYTLAELMPTNIKTWRESCHPDDLVCSEALLQQHFAGETEFYECEARMRHKSGAWVWVIDRGRVVEWDATGKPLRMVGTHLDITARKQAEIALRLSEDHYRGLTESLDSLIVTLDAEGRLLYLNQVAARLFGGTPQDFVGKMMTEIFPPEESIVQMGFVHTAIQEDRVLVVESQGRIRYESRWYRTSIFPIHDDSGRVMYALVNATDIHDLKTAQHQLLELNQTLEARVAQRTAEVQDLYDHAPVGYHSLDNEGRLVRINQTELDWLGYTYEEMIGRPLSDFMAAPGRDEFQANLALLKQQGLLRDIELEVIRKDGLTFPVLVSATALYDKTGAFVHSRSTMVDISERKRVEEILRQANLDMVHAARMKDAFLANMSHELRSPLNTILGFSENLQYAIYGPLTERQQVAIRHIETSGRHLLALINDILDLSKVEAGSMTLIPERINIAEVCKASLLFVKELAVRKSLELTLQLSDQSALIEADPKRLKQILVNLLSNAVKFTPEGGLVRLEVSVNAAEGMVCFAVRDTGIGIAQEDLAHLFQPFVQLESSLSRQHEGTGLGLALVRRLAEMHGGSVTVESELGQGSCFTIVLPQHPPMLGAEQQPMAAPQERSVGTMSMALDTKLMLAPRPASIRILLVEDNEHNIATTCDYLRAKGFAVIIARAGREALMSAIKYRPDLILMDIQLPEIDGLELMRRLRAMPLFTTTPIIALTALSMTGDQERCLEAGANAYLSKPFRLKELFELIERLVYPSTHG